LWLKRPFGLFILALDYSPQKWELLSITWLNILGRRLIERISYKMGAFNELTWARVKMCHASKNSYKKQLSYRWQVAEREEGSHDLHELKLMSIFEAVQRKCLHLDIIPFLL
jgi:hypothetical protein